jgi:hypothetical protein
MKNAFDAAHFNFSQYEIKNSHREKAALAAAPSSSSGRDSFVLIRTFEIF